MASNFGNKKLTLTHLFVAIFEDGHIIQQTPDDVSTIEPEKRSAFFDVLAYEATSPLHFFSLYEQSKGHSVGVDLRTGLFAIDGFNKFCIADQNFVPTSPFKLIYFRETRLETDVKMQTGKQDEIQSQRFYVNRYFIGWQTMWNNQNYQRTIAVQS